MAPWPHGARSLKILHVITGLGVGGAENMLTSLLTDSSHVSEASVVSLIPGGAMRGRLTEAGVPVLDLKMRRGQISPIAILRLAGIIGSHKPDIIQSWMYHADLVSTVALLLSGRRKLTRLIWGIRASNMDVSQYSLGLRIAVRVCAWLSRLPDAVVANSHAGAEVHESLGYRPRRLLVIPNGIDTERFCPDPAARAAVRNELGIAEDAVVLAHVARVDPMKDHEGLLAALERVPDVTALLIGDGTDALPDGPARLRLGRRTDVPRLLAACDIVVSSSAFGEGFSNAIGEGMAAGLPAVATDVGDSRVIVGETGRVVPPRDVAALADAIAELASLTPSERMALGARERIESEFPKERAVREFQALHRELIGAD